MDHLVLDVNGTLAIDGQLLPGVVDLLSNLRDHLTIHLLTADTHGKQAKIDQVLGLRAIRVKSGKEAPQNSSLCEENRS